MKKKEIWSIINVVDVVKNAGVEKVVNCYDFKSWEIEEMMNLENDMDATLNEFRWEYVRGTLELTNEAYSDIGFMVIDLIDDIKMGHYSTEDSDNTNSLLNVKGFEYKPYRSFESGKITQIEISYEDSNLSFEEKKAEIKELFSYLGIYEDDNIGCIYV